jgi:CubicO group peptidase (beta-lactamase class C family)
MCVPLLLVTLGLASAESTLAVQPPMPTLPDHPAQQDPAAIVDACAVNELAGQGSPGAAVAVILDGRIVFERGYGIKRYDDPDSAVDAQTQFRIGSSTKQFTAAGVLRLVDRGLVDLDAPLGRYVPEVRFAEAGFEDRVTIRDLLRHTSGLPDNSATQESDLYGKPDPQAMGRWVLAQGATVPHNPPGRFYNYSSANYMYAGHVIERVTGLSYPEYMKREVFEPAGMSNTTLVASEVEARGNFAFGHWQDIFHGYTLRVWSPSDQDNWARHPTGYVHSTAGDLVRWMDLLMDGGGDVLDPASAALMQASLVDMQERSAGRHYGFGVITETRGDLLLHHHPGSAWGWMATMDWVPERRFAVATLTNGYGALQGTADCAIEAWLNPRSVPDPPCPRTPERWPRWTGHYEGQTYVGDPWTMDVRQTPAGDLEMTLTAGGETFASEMRQTCGDARDRGAGSFAIDSNGDGGLDVTITFIEDPVEAGVVWIRHRQFVLRRAAGAEIPSPTQAQTPWPSSTPDPGPTTVPTTAPTGSGPVFLPWGASTHLPVESGRARIALLATGR